MEILFLTDSFNGMAQRLWIELDRLDHQVHVKVTPNGESMVRAVDKYAPALIIAPFLTVKIPEEVWKNHVCLIVHPGIKGDRGSSSLDWAILNREKEWGVTILQAVEKMDAGPVWATHNFEMRAVSKAELYRREVARAAAKGIGEAVARFEDPDFRPEPVNPDDPGVKGRWNRRAKQSDYSFSWEDSTGDILRKIRAADSSPGVRISLFGQAYFCYGGQLEKEITGKPGEVHARRNGAICIGTGDGAVWLTHLKSVEEESIKLPATMALGSVADDIPEIDADPFETADTTTRREIHCEQEGDVGYLHFDFYNGAMSTDQCRRLRDAFIEAKKRAKVIVLLGGRDVWSNGIHLNVIEKAKNPADEAWANINALDDLILEIIRSTDHYVICALQGNAGAGGVSLALSGDKLLARDGVVLNPHTKNMGLYGSEYWTYLLPKRIGVDKATKFTQSCLPWGMAVAREIGLVDHVDTQTGKGFRDMVKEKAQSVAALSYFDKLIMAKKFQRRKDELIKPLHTYREAELAHMHADFYDNENGFREKRFRFVHKVPNEKSTGLEDLYAGRRSIYRKRKWESISYNEG